MPAFYLTFIGVLLAGFGARDQVTIAGLTGRQGQRPGVLLVALACTGLTSALAAWAALKMLPVLPPPARGIFAAIAIGLAGLESMILAPRRNPKEPTNSLGALGLVLAAAQVTDAVRFLIFGLAVGLGAPLAAGAGGLLGGLLLSTFAWAVPGFLDRSWTRCGRRIVGAVLVLVALVIFLREFGLL
ncbi:hypothetical protein [Novosphingobium pentaromativorans]|uniref:GDT1 family protein n=1 Tax=Novosphingobium pentaromativorans US6-1 TaxID=1088721 RepID=G6E9Q2_9SPHN|nr:hypothetical protein [Novosphingobium pentaromativorans]AIT80947.1 hypothetical protein JI59_14745 [Novosphingobium pentaromativorans US6-1]EHJ61976.1 hypothetical protein NSU_1073 [Novosphingobium pentaromativorans US6-1]